MRKIIESTLVSLDGVIGDPHLWAMERFDDDAQKEALEGLLASDATLLGRRTYEIFAGVWPARTGAYADRLNSMPKFVFSSTLQKVDWNNSTIIQGLPQSASAALPAPHLSPRLSALLLPWERCHRVSAHSSSARSHLTFRRTAGRAKGSGSSDACWNRSAAGAASRFG
jgi:hypothetical protein